jgi:hypothetical protein
MPRERLQLQKLAGKPRLLVFDAFPLFYLKFTLR